MVDNLLQHDVNLDVNVVATIISAALSFIVLFIAFVLVDRLLRTDGTAARCSHCNYVLDHLTTSRCPEYLRIIYGPEYLAPEHLDRLRNRGLKHKRSLALREFALGLEALERFVRREPLRRTHECVFGVLALESEPVDPRL
jgi:hypothetical protein